MSDSDMSSTTATTVNLPPPTEETFSTPTSAPPPWMEESSTNPSPKAVGSAPSPITFSIWPPSQRTRDAVVTHLIETLSTPSVLSKRYGTLPQEEAAEAARAIEEEAFNAAGGASPASPDDEGLQILQIYSKVISKRMLDSVKAHLAASEGGDSAAAEPTSRENAVAEEIAVSEVNAKVKVLSPYA